MANFSPLRMVKRVSQPQYSELPTHNSPRRRYINEEKYGSPKSSTEEESESEYSEYESSNGSSCPTSGSYASDQPLKRKQYSSSPRRRRQTLATKTLRYTGYALISTIIIFVGTLIRMSVVSSKQVELGDLRERPPPPPPAWESFDFLARYYGGIRTLVFFEDNIPEYPRDGNETVDFEEAFTTNKGVPPSKPFQAYAKHSSQSSGGDMPMQECFLDEESKGSVPKLHCYEGRTNGFPDNVMGSYELLDLPEDICFDRYGRMGPYGYGYGLRQGGTGAGLHGDREGAESVWEDNGRFKQVDYRGVDWADAQRRCYETNSDRFEQRRSGIYSPTTFSVGKVQKGDDAGNISMPASSLVSKKTVPRTAVVVRAWDEFVWGEEDILNLRAMILELALGSGGEYDVHLLIQVKDEARYPVWADAKTYHEHLEKSVPEEFRGITTLWSQTQMLMLYQGLYDNYISGPTNPIHGSYRGLQMAMQHFSQRHPEYQFYWQWELDARYTGHYYHLFSRLDSWTKGQPRKGLWERNGRFYVPSIHGSWEEFKAMVRMQTEIGTDNPNNMWSGLGGAKYAGERPKVDRPIWGPERPAAAEDWFEIESDPEPPHSYEKDKYEWGVGEAADLITLNPLFDPDGTTWLLADDITGYNATNGLPPRRAAIVSAARMSKRLLNTMHRETAFKKHFAFSEMWAPTVALHHGYKAVYAPHPVFIDRDWPVDYLASVMNAGRNGATGGARTSVFGLRERQLKGSTWYYNAGFAPNLYRRWLGLKIDNEGGEQFELTRDEGKNGSGVLGMRGGEGRMCLPPMLLHPVKQVRLPVEEARDELGGEIERMESDPGA